MIVKFTCYVEGLGEHGIDAQMDGVPRVGESVWLATTDRVWEVFHVRWMCGESHTAEVALQ